MLPTGVVSMYSQDTPLKLNRFCRDDEHRDQEAVIPCLTDKDTVVQAVRELADELGHTPTQRQYLRVQNLRGYPPIRYVIQLFSSWDYAVLAAGLKPNRRILRVRPLKDENEKKARAIMALKTATEIIGYPPGVTEYRSLRFKLRRTDWPSEDAIFLMFDSWASALSECGFDPMDPRRRKTVAETLRRFRGRTVVAASELHRSPYRRMVMKEVLSDAGIVIIGRPSLGGRLSRLLVTAYEMGFPELNGHDRGRRLAIRLAKGESYKEMGEDEGLTPSRVCQIIQRYLTELVLG